MGADRVTLAYPIKTLQVPNRGGAVPVLAERREIIETQQFPRRLNHRIDVERMRPRNDEPRLARIHPVGRRREAVDVVAPKGREAGIESDWVRG